jgi:hypothetical protein
MDEIISYKMCAVKVRNAKLRNYLKASGKDKVLQVCEARINSCCNQKAF